MPIKFRFMTSTSHLKRTIKFLNNIVNKLNSIGMNFNVKVCIKLKKKEIRQNQFQEIILEEAYFNHKIDKYQYSNLNT